MENNENISILVMEDNEIFRDMIADNLAERGYGVTFLGSNATLDDVKRKNPDLALINITAPKGMGLKIIEGMSQDTELSSVPVMAIAKTEGSVLVDHARRYGVKYVVDRVIFDAEKMIEHIQVLLTKGDTPVETVTEEKPEEPVKEVPQKGNVLLVEDDVFMRELFAKNLREAGFVVHDVADANIATQILGEQDVDVVLLDLLLPGKSGFQFLSEVRRSEQYSHIPVIVVSNLGSKGDIDRALDLGASDFLVKANATIDEIVLKANEHIQKSKKAPRLPKSVMGGGNTSE